MDTKKLRQKILDLAIRGKLVPQDPNDEPASVLLERIRAEKEQLIKEGKIKRSKKSAASDTSHYENVPFEVPESWCWTTIEDLLINRDSERIPLSLAVRNKQHKKEYNYYGAAGVIDKVEGYLFSERLLLIGEDGANLLSRAKDNAFFADGKYWVNNHAHVLDCSEKEVLTYVALVINSMALDPYVTGSAQPKLSQDNLNKILIPLPPLAEQRRIIYAINNYSGYLSNIENDKESIEHIIDLLKQLILNLAITGKLVSQELNDEPAIELLKRIYPSFVPADNRHYANVPYKVPQKWQWVTMSDISNYGECINVPVSNIPENSWILELEDIEKDSGRLIQRMNRSKKNINGVRHSFKKGDVLYSKLRTYLNKVLVADQDGYCTTEIIPITCVPGIVPEYLCHVLRSRYYVDYTISLGYGVKMPRLGTADALKSMIPVPPYEEQRRIVKSVNEIYHKLEQISSEL